MNWNYISGFFDADGSITYLSSGKGRKKSIALYFTNNELVILETIQQFILNQTGCKGFISTKKPAKKQHQISYSLNFHDIPKTTAVLKKMKLFHPIKKHKSNLAFQLKAITPRNGKYTKELLKEREKFEKKFFRYTL